jgi:predicted anti-sigma-YlaC factor YlaD
MAGNRAVSVGDYSGMGCEECREAISAGLDGESSPAEEAAVATHVAGCPECRRFAEQAARVTRLARTRVAEPTPDLTEVVVAAARQSGRRPRRRIGVDAVRLALGAVGLAQFGLAVSGMVDAGAHHGVVELSGASAAHLANESSAWNLAVAVGFVWAAAGTRRAAGLLPVMTAFVGMLVALSALDAVTGKVEADRLVSHGLVVLGLVLLLALPRSHGDGDGARRPSGAGGRRRTTDRSTLPMPARGDDDEGLQPTARHRAA